MELVFGVGRRFFVKQLSYIALQILSLHACSASCSTGQRISALPQSLRESIPKAGTSAAARQARSGPSSPSRLSPESDWIRQSSPRSAAATASAKRALRQNLPPPRDRQVWSSRPEFGSKPRKSRRDRQ